MLFTTGWICTVSILIWTAVLKVHFSYFATEVLRWESLLTGEVAQRQGDLECAWSLRTLGCCKQENAKNKDVGVVYSRCIQQN